MRIIQNQTKEDSFIYWNDDPVIRKELEKFDVHAVCYPFSELKEKGSIGYIEEANTLLSNLNLLTWNRKIFLLQASIIYITP